MYNKQILHLGCEHLCSPIGFNVSSSSALVAFVMKAEFDIRRSRFGGCLKASMKFVFLNAFLTRSSLVLFINCFAISTTMLLE